MKKVSLIFIIVIIIMIVLFYNACSSCYNNSSSISNTPNQTHSPTPTASPSLSSTPVPTTSTILVPTPTVSSSPTPVPTPVNVLAVDYVDMFHNFDDDLYLNKWVQITGIVTIREFFLPIYFGEGLDGGWVSATDEEDTLKDMYETGDYVTVIGFIDTSPFITRTVHLERVIARLATSDEIAQIAVYANLREEAAAMKEREYKDSATTVSYNDLVRNPDDYMGRVLKVSGRVEQILGEGSWFYKTGYKFNEDSSSSKEWFVYYDLPEGASRILEKDKMVFYGEFNGIEKFTRVIGGDVYIPTLKAVYTG